MYRQIVILSLVIHLANLENTSWATLTEPKPTASQLMKAPIILVGEVIAISKLQDTAYGQNNTPVSEQELTVSVDQILRGRYRDKQIVIRGLFSPLTRNSYLGFQIPEVGRKYVFFLTSKGEVAKQWNPVNLREFALENHETTEGKADKESIIESLRRVAKQNILRGNDELAIRWFSFLAEIYDVKQDHEFCLKYIDDKRAQIRGDSLALMSQYHPEIKSLYSKSIAFLEEQVKTDQVNYQIRERISTRSLQILKIQEPERVSIETKRWLRKDERLFWESALDFIVKEKKLELEQDVIDRMLKTGDKDLRYNCYKGLCSLFDKQPTSYALFNANPKRYISEIQLVAENYKLSQ